MKTGLQRLWRRRLPLAAWFGLTVILAYALVALLAPWLAPHGQSDIVAAEPFAAWSTEFPLGTDQLGRDVLSRMIYATRNSVGIALATTLLAFCVGGSLGVLAALAGGWVDQISSRLIDVVMAIPELILALVLLSVVGTSILNLILIIALVDATRVFRLSRAAAMNVVVADFVEAAQLRGEGRLWLIGQEILPNIAPALIAEFGLRFCFVFLSISALSFLGLGIQPPTADWGSMVRDNATLITYDDITPLVPAGAIALLTVAVNFVVDWYLDERQGSRSHG